MSSSFRIRFALQQNGINTAVDYVVLRDAAATFGVRRVSSGLVILPAGEVVPPDPEQPGENVYALTVGNLIAGELYQYAIEWAVDGIPDRVTRTVEAPPEGAVGAYITQGDLIDHIGEENLAAISDVENDEPGGGIDEPRTGRGIAYAEARLEMKFAARGIFATPLTGLGAGEQLIIKTACAEYAAWWLSRWRGVGKTDDEDFSGEGAAQAAAARTAERKRLATMYADLKAHADATIDDLHLAHRGFRATRRGVATRPVSVGAVLSLPRRVYVPALPIPPLYMRGV